MISRFFLATFALVAACTACVRPKKSETGQAGTATASGVVIPPAALDDFGAEPELLDVVFSVANLQAALARQDTGEPVELNVVLREDWQSTLPIRLKSGDVRKFDSKPAGADVVAIGDVPVFEFRHRPANLAMLKAIIGPDGDAGQFAFDLVNIKVSAADVGRLSATINSLHKLSPVVLAEPNAQYTKDSKPNDLNYGAQWGLGKIAAPLVWSATTSAEKAVIAILDTGVDYNHPDLRDNIWNNSREIAGNGIDDDGNGFIDDVRGWDFVAEDADPMDVLGHGSHCAGIAAARGNNKLGIAGVSWSARIMPVKVLNDIGKANDFDLYSGILYAIANGARVLSNSYGSPVASALMSDAVLRSLEAGRLFVAAAGNNSAPAALYPAMHTLQYPNVLSVASTDSNDSLSSFSNHIGGVDLAAPGRSILSTMPQGQFRALSGTSMATPFVAGAAALLWSTFPASEVAALRNAIISGVDVIPALQGQVTSSGRLNVKRAFDVLAAGSPLPPQPAYQSGLAYKFYEGRWDKFADFTLISPTGSGVADVMSEKHASRKENYALVFDGFIKISDTARYTFYLGGSGNSRLFIDNRLVASDTGGGGTKSGRSSLATGFHTVRLEYLHKSGGASLDVGWSKNRSKKRKKLTGDDLFFH